MDQLYDAVSPKLKYFHFTEFLACYALKSYCYEAGGIIESEKCNGEFSGGNDESDQMPRISFISKYRK